MYGVIGTPPSDRHRFDQSAEFLTQQVDGRSFAWYGRAMTAIHAALKALRLRGETASHDVIVPSIACAGIVNVVEAAGFNVVFGDVDPRSGMMTLEDVQQAFTSQTRAVILIHLFGGVAPAKSMARWCRENNVALIEDVAQAAAGKDGRDYAGSHGDFSIFSFSPDKILSGGGGLLVARSPMAESALQKLDIQYGRPTIQKAQWVRHYRDMQLDAIRRRWREGVSPGQDFVDAARQFTPMYLRPFDATCRPAPPDRSIEELDRRMKLAERYAKRLNGGPWSCLTTWQDSGVCWRFSLLTDSGIDAHRLSEAVRRDGFHVSNLFWPLHQLFGVDKRLPGAEKFGPSVVNLWVSDVDIAYVDACCSSLSQRVESSAVV